MVPATRRKPGIVYTFYSYKGGVGRSMALANAAALLAKWGRSVLIVDWDLEASGIESFFEAATPGLRALRDSTPGVVDLIQAKAEGRGIDWTECLIAAYPFGANSPPLSLITAGRSGDGFRRGMQDLDFARLFAEADLGTYIEELRNEWISRFDIVLIDSRTGITDIGGICTIHLPDVLVLLFTTTETSVQGVIDVVTSARKQQAKLPFDRRKLLALPVPARDESRTEYQKSEEWKRRFAERFAEFYKDWLPAERTPMDVLNLLRIPYIPFWSFGETLPVVEQGTSDPSSLGHAYEVLARLIETDLEWHKVLSGEVISPVVSSIERPLDDGWVRRNLSRALDGLTRTGRKGFVEVVFHSPNAIIDQPQDALLEAARTAQDNHSGWPFAVVVDSGEGRPRSMLDEIRAEVVSDNDYDYWCLTKQGEFYSLRGLDEDYSFFKGQLLFESCVVRATESLMYSSRLLRALGGNDGTKVRLEIRYGGLRSRALHSTRMKLPASAVSAEEAILSEVSFFLGELDREMADLVEKLCTPLFLVFDYQRFPRAIYAAAVSNTGLRFSP